MLQSRLFTKTRREAPADETSKNAELLIRAGFIFKEMAGVYSYLPLGFRVMKKIENIIREEMNAIGGQEVLMTTLQNPEIWKKTGRWTEEKTDPLKGLPWFKTELVTGVDLGIANTHEEALTNIAARYVGSYKDLPFSAYQIQNKFRNELRAKSGLLRCREFIMKDLYSFDRNEEERDLFYEKVAEAYMKIFTRTGLGDRTYRTFASGGAFSKYSDEFQTLSETGEDTIYIDEKKKLAVNKEVYNDEVLSELGMNKEKLREAKAIEVGNIFKLGTRYSEPLGLKYRDEKGIERPVVMASYGIGLGRLMGTVAEVLSDEKGLIWPESVAPFRVHLLEFSQGLGKSTYEELQKSGVDVLYDDRDASPGEKMADADLIGIPWRFIVSEKTVGKVEVKARLGGEPKILELDEAIKLAIGK